MSDMDFDDLLPELWWYGALDETHSAAVAPGQVNLNQVLQAITSGTQGEAKRALSVIAALRPPEMIQPLLNAANARATDIAHKCNALYAIGLIGGQPAARALLDFKPSPECKPAWCHALGLTRHPAALPTLIKTLHDGMSLAIWSSSSPHEQYTYGFLARGFTLLSIGRIGDAGVIRPLVEDASREWLATEFHENEENILSNSSNLGLALLGAGLAAWQEKKKTATMAAVMVNPSLSIQFVADLTSDVKRAWMLNLRVGMLRWLAHKNGTAQLAACRSIARDNTQALMVALPMLFFEIQPQWLDILAKATKSVQRIERILAFDGWVRAAAKSHEPSFFEWVQLGLRDKDSLVRSAVGASILLNNLTELEPQVLRFAQSQSKDVRISLLPALTEAVLTNPDSPALAALFQIANADPDKQVREMAQELIAGREEGREERMRLVQEWITMLETQYGSTEDSEPAAAEQQPAAANSSDIDHPVASAPPAAMDDTRHCLFCGEGIPRQATFCPHCGKSQAG